MSFRLTFAPTAGPSFAVLPRRVQRQFDQAFGLLQQQPRTPGTELDVHQLYGYQNVWTLRIPPYRGIYAIDGGEVVLVVFGHRDTVYSALHRLLPPRRQTVTLTSVSRRK
jgi:mRNA-degrading endonuclease RelE of RelBE toxin-antitoxin system